MEKAEYEAACLKRFIKSSKSNTFWTQLSFQLGKCFYFGKSNWSCGSVPEPNSHASKTSFFNSSVQKLGINHSLPLGCWQSLILWHSSSFRKLESNSVERNFSGKKCLVIFQFRFRCRQIHHQNAKCPKYKKIRNTFYVYFTHSIAVNT